jgi:hypothetical protein
VETILPVRGSPGYIPAFKTIIPPDKDKVFVMAVITNKLTPVHVYTDGSGFKGGIGAAALLYIRECLVKVLQVHLGSASEHTIYKAEGIDLLLGLHLLKGLSHQLTHATVLGTNNQAVIKALGNQTPHAGQYILDAIHKAAEELNAKQDHLINNEERARAIEARNEWVGRIKGVINLQIHWVQASILFQLRSGHIGLNLHLFHI